MTMVRNAIVVDGKPFACTVNVLTWHETGFKFATARTRAETRWVINHWTAAENGAEQTFRGMASHKNAQGEPEPLSVHFIVDQLGVAYQLADTEARCAHCVAGGGNSYGVGIEIINRGHSKNPDKGFIRPRLEDRIHGQLINYGAFFPAQIATVVALNRAICAAYNLPVHVPLKNGDVNPGLMTDAEREAFRGSAGHYQFERGKVDPATDVLRRIHQSGLVS